MALYPSLNIQGEESKESTATVDSVISSDLITDKVKSFVTQGFLNEQHKHRLSLINDVLRKTYGSDEISSANFETFNTKDAVVWIDPLDGT